MVNRGRREALVLFALMATAVLVFGAVTVVSGDEAAEQPSDTRTLEPMPAPPALRWKVDAGSLFGSEFRGAGVTMLAADEDVLIVRASAIALGKPSAMLALDPDTGRSLWNTPRVGWDSGCALSGDGGLACTRLVREEGAVVNRVSFIDLRSGEDMTTATIRTAGSSTISRAGDGFLVETNHIENIAVPEELSDRGPFVAIARMGAEIPDQQVTITKFDSHARQTWSAEPPINHEQLAVSEAADLLAVGDRSRGGFTVYRLDTGKTVVSQQRPANGEADSTPDVVVLHPSGFATSHSPLGDYLVEFFDAEGKRTGELPGWRLAPGDFERVIAVDGEDLAVSSGSAVGMVSTRTHTVNWESDTARASLEVLDSRYVASYSDSYSDDFPGSQTWTVFEVHTGEQQGQSIIGFGQGYVGFDGTRMLFDGEPKADHRPNVASLSAYDAKTGGQVWRLPPPSPTARWHVAAPYLLLIEDGADGKPGAIARYSP